MQDLRLAHSGARAEVAAVLEGVHAEGGGARPEFRLVSFAGQQRPHGRAAEFQRADEQIGDEEDPERSGPVPRGMRLHPGQATADGGGDDGLAGSGVDEAQHEASLGGRARLRRQGPESGCGASC